MGKLKRTHSTPLTEKIREFYHWTICNDSSRSNRLNVVLGYRDYDDRGLNTWLLQLLVPLANTLLLLVPLANTLLLLVPLANTLLLQLLVSKKQKVNYSLFHCWGFKQRQLYSMTSSSSVTEDAQPLVFSVMFLLNSSPERPPPPPRWVKLLLNRGGIFMRTKLIGWLRGGDQQLLLVPVRAATDWGGSLCHMTITWPQPTLTQCQCL